MNINVAVLAALSSTQLAQLAQIKQRSENEISAVLGNTNAGQVPTAPQNVSRSSAAGAPPIMEVSGLTPTGRPKRHMSPEARQAIADAQKKRWAKVRRDNKGSTVTGDKRFTPAARKRISEAQKARWAKIREAQAGQMQNAPIMTGQPVAA